MKLISIFIGFLFLISINLIPENTAKYSAKISKITFDYWEGCETGQGECKPLVFTRKFKGQQWKLEMPCAGTSTTVTLSEKKDIPKENDILQRVNVTTQDCPPIFDLTHLSDGQYYADMLGCGLGGRVEIHLKTES